MRGVLQYILHEVKEGRLSKPGAVELTREIHTQGKLDQPSVLHPLLHRDTSDLTAQRFSARLNGEEAYLHGVNGARVLPEVAHLEMARAAVAAAAGGDAQDQVRLEQVEWLQPVVVGSGGTRSACRTVRGGRRQDRLRNLQRSRGSRGRSAPDPQSWPVYHRGHRGRHYRAGNTCRKHL